MLRHTCRAMAMASVLFTTTATADTGIVSAGVQGIQGAPAFRMVVGIPPELARGGPAVVGDGALASDTIYAFPERQGVTLTQSLNPGRGKPIPAGTRVDSFYVCVDTASAGAGSSVRNGSNYAAVLRFDNSAYLATVLRPPQLASTAAVLGRPDVTYANSRNVGVDPFFMGQDNQDFAGGDFVISGEANGIDCRRVIFRAKG